MDFIKPTSPSEAARQIFGSFLYALRTEGFHKTADLLQAEVDKASTNLDPNDDYNQTNTIYWVIKASFYGRFVPMDEIFSEWDAPFAARLMHLVSIYENGAPVAPFWQILAEVNTSEAWFPSLEEGQWDKVTQGDWNDLGMVMDALIDDGIDGVTRPEPYLIQAVLTG